MNKSDLITLLKSAECGSDELNVAYYEWKYPDSIIRKCGVVPYAYLEYREGSFSGVLRDVSNSVDAALGEIPERYRSQHDIAARDLFYVTMFGEGMIESEHKSLPIAILLAVVEAAV
jgi:hypothetical protein